MNKCIGCYHYDSKENLCIHESPIFIDDICTDYQDSEFIEQIKADLIREVEKKVRAEVIEELFNIHCKDVSQNECDGYGGRCYQCKYERLVQKSLEMQELKIEEQK